MLINTDGIVLRKIPYGENTLIVSVYTAAKGIISLTVKGKKNGAKALLSPLSIIRVVVDLRNNRNLHYPKEISLATPFKSIPFDPHKGTVLLFINELLIKVLKEEEPNQPLFDFIVNALKTLDQPGSLHPGFHLAVMLHLTKFLGFFPQSTHWKDGLQFHLKEGVFVNPYQQDPSIADSEVSKVLYEFINIGFDQYQQLRLNRHIRSQLLDLLILYYQLHIPGFGNMKSVDVLRTVFA